MDRDMDSSGQRAACYRAALSRVATLRRLYDEYTECSAQKAHLFGELQGRLPVDEASRERLAQVDAAKKRAVSTVAARQRAEARVAGLKGELAARRGALAAKKERVLRDLSSVEDAGRRLAEAVDTMYTTTFNRLSIAQQNLTYRRWELAQGVAHIFSLSTIDALKTPPASPSRPTSRQAHHGGHHGGSPPYEALTLGSFGGHGGHGGVKDISSPGAGALGGASASGGGPMGGRQRNISICGLELDSSVIKKNKDVLMENDNGNNVERLAAALGYVAHIVQLLATYFDIPLRYPVKSNNSRSYVEESTSKNSKFPLYIDHRTYVERERTRFAYAVFLLNKDIEQILNAHGLDAYGVAPHQILNNLHKFLSFSN